MAIEKPEQAVYDPAVLGVVGNLPLYLCVPTGERVEEYVLWSDGKYRLRPQ